MDVTIKTTKLPCSILISKKQYLEIYPLRRVGRRLPVIFGSKTKTARAPLEVANYLVERHPHLYIVSSVDPIPVDIEPEPDIVENEVIASPTEEPIKEAKGVSKAHDKNPTSQRSSRSRGRPSSRK